MNFKFVDELGLNLKIDLIALQRNSQRYSLLLYQHEGTLKATEHAICNNYSVNKQLSAFFNKAKEKNVDLALTPEYSCPWDVLTSVIKDEEYWPMEGKLWIIGCESINLDSIKSFKSTYSQGNVIIYYDEGVYSSNKSFLDPIVYLFKAQHEDNSKLIILIQFKTHHMGVWSGGDIERNNLIQGKEIYILRNSPNSGNSINLFTLICSEAINFKPDRSLIEKLDWEDKPYLIFNPQLNPDPTHEDFISFRKLVFNETDKEIISLNWQIDSKIHGDSMLKYGCSRSGFYFKSTELNLVDKSRITSNHNKGLYIFNNKKSRFTYLLSSSPHCFLIENLPVKISNGRPAQIKRDGPEVISTFQWEQASNSYEEITYVDDNHISYLNGIGCRNSFLLDSNTCVIDKERLVCLSTGEVDGNKGKYWSTIDNVHSFLMEDNNEINTRITVTRNNFKKSLDQRKRYIKAIENLQKIIDDKSCLPESLVDLKSENLLIQYHPESYKEDYKFNLTTTSGEIKFATVAYLDYPDDKEVNEVFKNLRKMFDSTNNKDKGRVVVFYTRGPETLTKFDKNATKLASTDDYDDTSILKDNDE